MVHHEQLPVKTRERTHLTDITAGVQQAVSKSGIRNGMVTVASLHTTAGMTINENADPDVARDIVWKLDRMAPRRDSYHHCEGNSDSHVKTSLVGLNVQVPLVEGRLELGTWQSIYFCEFDGPRNRRVSVTIIGE